MFSRYSTVFMLWHDSILSRIYDKPFTLITVVVSFFACFQI